MPVLPNLPNIPQSQFDRIVAAFPGADAAEKTASYRQWLTNRLIERVELHESRQIDEDANVAKRVALQALRDSLPPREDEPLLP